MWILNSQEMKSADKKTIEELGIPGLILMENAGIAVVNVIDEIFDKIDDVKFLVVCGRGNNGGDGFVVARHLIRRNADIEIFLVGESNQLKGDALANYNMLRAYTERIHEIKDERDFGFYKELLNKADVIVDALFGTGLTTPLSDLNAEVVDEINKQNALIISIDIPSGLSSDTGEIIGPCINADITVTLAAPKWCHIFPPAEQKCGEIFIADIGIPDIVLTIADPHLKLISEEDIEPALQPRNPDTHKNSYGDILILAGSPGKAGAAYMTAHSALKSGAGLVTLAVPDSCHEPLMSKVVEVMTMGLACTSEGTFSYSSLPVILQFAEDKDLIAIGPGITTHPDSIMLVRDLIAQYSKIMIIDADGINAIASDITMLANKTATLILTPHPGEMARLLKMSTKDVQKNRAEVTQEFAMKNNLILVLKGYRTTIGLPNGMVYVNSTGNAGMATAGSGDVLTGMIAGLVAQNLANLPAAVITAVYLHGLAGDLAKEKYGEIPLMASDIIKFIPKAIKKSVWCEE